MTYILITPGRCELDAKNVSGPGPGSSGSTTGPGPDLFVGSGPNTGPSLVDWPPLTDPVTC